MVTLINLRYSYNRGATSKQGLTGLSLVVGSPYDLEFTKARNPFKKRLFMTDARPTASPTESFWRGVIHRTPCAFGNARRRLSGWLAFIAVKKVVNNNLHFSNFTLPQIQSHFQAHLYRNHLLLAQDLFVPSIRKAQSMSILYPCHRRP